VAPAEHRVTGGSYTGFKNRPAGTRGVEIEGPSRQDIAVLGDRTALPGSPSLLHNSRPCVTSLAVDWAVSSGESTIMVAASPGNGLFNMNRRYIQLDAGPQGKWGAGHRDGGRVPDCDCPGLLKGLSLGHGNPGTGKAGPLSQPDRIMKSRIAPSLPFQESPKFVLPGAAALTALVQIAAAVPTTSYNSGSLGKVADGASTTGVVVDQAGAIAAFQDFSSSYSLGERTEVPFRSELNPAANSPFTIEFWAKPTSSDNDDAPVGNRLATGNRTGWVFFQRTAAVGWNFRTYNGNGSTVGWDVTGGTSTLNEWSWSGTARLPPFT
jgi:hypothetical protein